MKNILVIDDDLHIGNVLEETLTNEGYGVSYGLTIDVRSLS